MMPAKYLKSRTLIAFLLGGVCGYGIVSLSGSRDNRLQGGDAPTNRSLSSQLSASEPALQGIATSGSSSGESIDISLSDLAQLHPESYQRAQLEWGRAYLETVIEDVANTDPQAAARLLSPGRLSQHYGLAQSLVASWSESDPAAALSWLQANRESLKDSEYETGLQTAVEAFAKIDPEGIYNKLGGLVGEENVDQYLYTIAGGWADRSPGEAAAWLANLPEDGIAPEALTGAYTRIMESYVEQSPQRAAAAIKELQSEQLQGRLAPLAAAALAKDGLGEALAWVDTFANDGVKSVSAAAILSQAIEEAPGRALDTLLEVQPYFQNQSPEWEDTLDRIAAREPEALQSKFDALAPRLQEASAASLAQAYLDEPDRPGADLKWLESQSAPVADAAHRVVARHHSETDPVAALGWARKLSDSAERVELMSRVLGDSPSETLPEIATILNTLNLPAAEQESLTQALNRRRESTFSELVIP